MERSRTKRKAHDSVFQGDARGTYPRAESIRVGTTVRRAVVAGASDTATKTADKVTETAGIVSQSVVAGRELAIQSGARLRTERSLAITPITVAIDLGRWMAALVGGHDG